MIQTFRRRYANPRNNKQTFLKINISFDCSRMVSSKLFELLRVTKKSGCKYLRRFDRAAHDFRRREIELTSPVYWEKLNCRRRRRRRLFELRSAEPNDCTHAATSTLPDFDRTFVHHRPHSPGPARLGPTTGRIAPAAAVSSRRVRRLRPVGADGSLLEKTRRQR